MKVPKLITDYGKFSDAVLIQKAVNVKTSLTGNLNFPTTLPSLEDFTTLQNDFVNALNKASTGDRVQIALKNQARTALVAAMRQLANDIDAQANGRPSC
ncbi:hypothetical protein EIM50_17270 [Pseudoxanthomonas sp. SGD-10]|nr:hypothetical protein EIM50_17270 [Pseudoxanthomonas sp. SGD-10]